MQLLHYLTSSNEQQQAPPHPLPQEQRNEPSYQSASTSHLAET